MNAVVHHFPGSSPQPEKKPVAPAPRPAPVFKKFEPDQAKELCLVVREVLRGCEALQAYVAANREVSRESGIESIMIEMTAIMEGPRMERVVDALEDAMLRGTSVSLTTTGLMRVRRLESLLAESSKNLSRFSAIRFPGERTSPVILNLGETRSSSSDAIWTGCLIFAGVAITLAVVYAASK